MPKATNSTIPAIPWTANDHELTWMLLAEMGKLENYKVLFGKVTKDENTSGDTKITVCKRIGEALLPNLFPEHAGTVGERVRGKINDLHKQYVKHAKKLRQTGGGLHSGESQTQEEAGGDQYLDFYIPPDGPDHDTDPTARNLWEQITKEFPFFPSLHLILATRPNATPIAVTTGVGPHGRQTLHLQAPSSGDDQASSAARPAARSFGTSLNDNAPLVTPQRGPRASTLSQSMVENAKSKITKLPQKRSFEDRIIELQEKNIEASDRREAEERALKKRKMLLHEFELKIWTREEYQQRLAAIENSVKVSDSAAKENQPASSSSPVSTPIPRQRISSPAWDIEDDARPLPSSDSLDADDIY